jgi:hypothetical protein
MKQIPNHKKTNSNDQTEVNGDPTENPKINEKLKKSEFSISFFVVALELK